MKTQPNFIADAAAYLDQHADELDGWARQSRSGGWSTHQVDANVAAANECRRQASALRKAELARVNMVGVLRDHASALQASVALLGELRLAEGIKRLETAVEELQSHLV